MARGNEQRPGDFVQQELPTTPKELKEAVANEVARQVDEFPPQIQHAFALSLQQGSAPNQLLEKLTPEQLGRVIELTECDSQREHSRFKISLFVGVGGFLALSGMLLYAQKPEMLKDILALFATFIGGFGSGYYLRSKSK